MKDNNVFENEATYKTQAVIPGVLVKIPGKNNLETNPADGDTARPRMKYIEARNMRLTKEPEKGTIFVPAAYAYADQQGGVWLVRNFYVREIDLGRKVCSEVHVVIKTLPDGRQFHMIDIHPTPDVRATVELKWMDAQMSADDIKVLSTRTDKWMHFKAIKVRTAATNTDNVKVINRKKPGPTNVAEALKKALGK